MKSYCRAELERLDRIEAQVVENETAITCINVQLSLVVKAIRSLHEENVILLFLIVLSLFLMILIKNFMILIFFFLLSALY